VGTVREQLPTMFFALTLIYRKDRFVDTTWNSTDITKHVICWGPRSDIRQMKESYQTEKLASRQAS